MIPNAMWDTATTDTGIEPAPLARRLLAGLIDAAVMSLPVVLQARRTWRAGGAGGTVARQPRWTSMLPGVREILGEQVGTPGGWIMSVRTVDKRTGRRVGLWRTLVVALVQISTRLLSQRLNPRPTIPSETEQRQGSDEIQAIKERHAEDEEALNAELMSHYAKHRVDVSVRIWPTLVAGVGSTLLNRWIRRRLAPTVVVARAPGKWPASFQSP
jgi:hypothetical protein